VLSIHGCRKGHDGVCIERFHAEFSCGDVSSVDTRLQKSCASTVAARDALGPA